MKPETLLECAQTFCKLIGAHYTIHLGRAGRHIRLELNFEKEDIYHLMGLHYLNDRNDRRSRSRIIDDLLLNPDYRQNIASSDCWNRDLESRVACTTILEKLIDDNDTIFRYNPNKHYFYSRIQAEYLLSHSKYKISDILESDVYLFIDKRNNSQYRFCKSVFPKRNMDYTLYQTRWTLLYKEKISIDGKSTILYQHKNYSIEKSP